MWKAWRFLSSNKKSLYKRPLSFYKLLLAVTAHDPQKDKQALKNINCIHIQSQGGANVVGFTAINESLDIVEHKGAEDANR